MANRGTAAHGQIPQLAGPSHVQVVVWCPRGLAKKMALVDIYAHCLPSLVLSTLRLRYTGVDGTEILRDRPPGRAWGGLPYLATLGFLVDILDNAQDRLDLLLAVPAKLTSAPIVS